MTGPTLQRPLPVDLLARSDAFTQPAPPPQPLRAPPSTLRRVRIDNANIEGADDLGYDSRLVPDLSRTPTRRPTDRLATLHRARATGSRALRDRICAEFEAIEREAGSHAAFDYLPWEREEDGNDNPGAACAG